LIYALAPSVAKPIIKSVSEPNSVNSLAHPHSHLLRILVRLSTSLQFALALHLSNLNDARRVCSFLLLPFHRAFDPSLAFVAIGALSAGLLLYHFARGDGARLGGTTIVKTGKIDVRLLAGSAIFGIGWGMSGICPGPGLVNFGLSLSTRADFAEIASFASWLGCMALGGLLVSENSRHCINH